MPPLKETQNDTSPEGGRRVRKRGYSYQEILADPVNQDPLRAALQSFDETEVRDITGWMAYAYFDTDEGVWKNERITPETLPYGRPFAGLAGSLRSGKIQLVGPESPLPQDMQDLLVQKFPQEFLPFEEVPYWRFRSVRWFDHPQFQNELLDALRAYDRSKAKYKRFWSWIDAVEFDEAEQTWKAEAPGRGKWASLSNALTIRSGFERRDEIMAMARAEDSPYPEELRRELRDKFPAEFSPEDTVVHYGMVPVKERLLNATFHEEVETALRAYDPEKSGKKTLTQWFSNVFFNAETSQWEFQSNAKGPWRWLEIDALVASIDTLPPSLQELLRLHFPENFMPIEEVDYQVLEAPEWLKHPVFHDQLRAALTEFENTYGITFIHWIKTVDFRMTPSWDAVRAKDYKKNPGPWKRLSGYFETHRAKRGMDWRELLIGADLPEDIQLMIMDKFPQHFTDPYTNENYHIFPSNFWLGNKHYQIEMLTELRKIDGVAGVGFHHWLSTYAALAEGEEVVNNMGPWSRLAHDIKRQQLLLGMEGLLFLTEKYNLPDELVAVLKEKFPIEFGEIDPITTDGYMLIDTQGWFHNKVFQAELLEELTAYIPDGKMNFFSWLTKVAKISAEDIEQTNYLKRYGPWYRLAIYLNTRKKLLDTDTLAFIIAETDLSDELIELLKEKFPVDFTVFDTQNDQRYQFLSTSEWFGNRVFQQELLAALQKFSGPRRLGFQTWLGFSAGKNPRENEKYSAWYGLTAYIRKMKDQNKSADFRFLLEQFNLPQELVSELQKKFPLDFTEFNQVEDERYYILPVRKWLSNRTFQSLLLTQAKKLKPRTRVGFIRWLDTYSGPDVLSQTIGEPEKKKPWATLAVDVRSRREMYEMEDLQFLIKEHDFPDELVSELKKRFPGDFLEFKGNRVKGVARYSERVKRISDALHNVGLHAASVPYVFQHLEGKLPDIALAELEAGVIESLKTVPNQDKSTRNGLRFFLSLSQRMNSLFTKFHLEHDQVMASFTEGIFYRLIREEFYMELEGTGETDALSLLDIATTVAARLKPLCETLSEEMLSQYVDTVALNLAQAMEKTEHLRTMFTHPLSVEQRRVIYESSASEGKHLIAHAPGEGKTAIALAGAWEFMKKEGTLGNGIVLFFGTNAAIDNLQRTSSKLNPEYPDQFTLAKYNIKDQVSDRFTSLYNALRNPPAGPLIIPITYSMLEDDTVNEFNTILQILRTQSRPSVVIGDEFHHMLGKRIFLTNTGYQNNKVMSISSPDKDGNVFAVTNAPSKILTDFVFRTARKSLVVTGSPLNTDLAQLLHVASIMESSMADGKLHYPSFEQMRVWIEDPVALSAYLHTKMSRSSHLKLPDVENIILECSFREDLQDLAEEEEVQLSAAARIGLEVTNVLPYLTSILSHSREFPVVISVPYVDETKTTRGASTRAITTYLRKMGLLGAEQLDSKSTPTQAQDSIDRFRDDGGVDILVFSPAYAESRDFQGSRPISVVISIGASTVRSYEQAIRRVVRFGNKAEQVYIITPVVTDAPFPSLLRRRQELLQDRLSIATAVLDPVALVRKTKSTSTVDLDELLNKVIPEDLPKPVFDVKELQKLPDSFEETARLRLPDAKIWDGNGSLRGTMKTFEERAAAIIKLRGILQQQDNPELGAYLDEIRSFQADMAGFLLSDASYILQQTAVYPGALSETAARETVSALFQNFVNRDKDQFLNYFVIEPVIAKLETIGLSTVDRNFAPHVSDRALLILLRQSTNSEAQQFAWVELSNRYNKLIASLCRDVPRDLVEDVQQEIWIHMMKPGTYLPYTTLGSAITYQIKGILPELQGGKRSIDAASFSDFDNPDDDRPFDERKRVKSLLDN